MESQTQLEERLLNEFRERFKVLIEQQNENVKLSHINENAEIDILKDYNPVKLKFMKQTMPTAVVTEYGVELPPDLRRKVIRQLKDRYGEDVSIEIGDIPVKVYSK